MLVLTVTTGSVFLNPILSLLGYRLYDVEYEFGGFSHSTTVLTRAEIKSQTTYPFISILRFLYFIKK
jgi:hypothetical protein